MFSEKFPLVPMGGGAVGQVCADSGARPQMGASEILGLKKRKKGYALPEIGITLIGFFSPNSLPYTE
jgi:hypothetical protein